MVIKNPVTLALISGPTLGAYDVTSHDIATQSCETLKMIYAV